MNPILTDNGGAYIQVQGTAGSLQLVNRRTMAIYETVAVAANTYPGILSVAPNLSDLGGGIWVDGALVDPPA